jgi:RNA polymerase sigma-70 factor (ECF subfamily)
MNAEDEAKLVQAARSGDADAFARLFDRYANLLAGRVRKVVPAQLTRKVSVADILQEVRITAFRRFESFELRGEGSVRNWLMRILEHKIGDVFRKYRGAAKRAAHVEVTRGQRPDTHNVRGSGGTPSQAVIAAESRRLLRETLALLPDDYRTILRLVFVEQLSLREAGEEMGRSREAAKKLYGRALARLTELHGRAQGGENDD